jgi:hypothetical protein
VATSRQSNADRSREERPGARAPASMETGVGQLHAASLDDAASLGDAAVVQYGHGGAGAGGARPRRRILLS